MIRQLCAAAAVAAGLSLFTGTAHAIIISCPGTVDTGDREFTLDTTPGASCLAFGAGNINGNNDAINLLGYVTLDKSDDATTGDAEGSLVVTPPDSGLSGTFSFTPPGGFTGFVIAFKSGEGQLDPDWAAFLLPAGVTSGSWAISGQHELSHANLYGAFGPTQVPEPGSLGLLALVALGLGILRRRAR